MVKNIKSIKMLNLGKNNITDEFISYISRTPAIAENLHATELRLLFNKKITDLSVPDLHFYFERNPYIRRINLDGTSVTNAKDFTRKVLDAAKSSASSASTSINKGKGISASVSTVASASKDKDADLKASTLFNMTSDAADEDEDIDIDDDN